MPQLAPPAASLVAAYDVEQFRTQGHALIDQLADVLAATQRGAPAVVPWQAPAAAAAHWQARWAQLLDAPTGPSDLATSGNAVRELVAIAQASTALHHPRCMGHQVAAPLPIAALAEMVAAYCNNGVGVYEMGPAGVPIELAVVGWLAQRLGLPAQASGSLTSGGSVGNLTALLAMRQLRGAGDSWQHGCVQPLTVLVGAHAHYSIDRAVKMMGWGSAGTMAVPLNADFQMTAAAAAQVLAVARAQGRVVIGLVAAAGSTATGAFDELPALAELAAREGLWLHVDGAHGAGLAFSRQASRRARLDGIALADSVVWDAHKMLQMPALVTAVLFRAPHACYAPFAQHAAYLFADGAAQDTWWDLGQRTLECTKRMMAIELWAAVAAHGADIFADAVDRQCELAARFAEILGDDGGFDIAHQPQANILCYRVRGLPHATPAARDARTRAIRETLVRAGGFYIVGTTLPDGYYLRSAFMNPMATEDDLQALRAALRAAAQQVDTGA